LGEGTEDPSSEEYITKDGRLKRDVFELEPNFEIEYDSEPFLRFNRRILNETEGGNATYKVTINGTEVERPRPLKMLNAAYYAAKKKFYAKPATNSTNTTIPTPAATGAAPAPDPAAAAPAPEG